MTQRATQVAVVQMTSTPEVEQNLKTAGALVAAAAEAGARTIVLPECFAYLGPDRGNLDVAERLPAGGPILSQCRAWAKGHDVELVLGGFWEKTDDPGRVRNACIHMGADGEVQAVYRKIHLFDVDLPDGTSLKESTTVEPGNEVVVADTRAGRMGLSVCYDLRFPELYRKLVDDGATSIAVPAAFTLQTGKDHWHVLLQARAIESQSYVLAAAQTGHHFGRRVSYGHAMVIDPWGCVLSQCPEGEGFALATIEPDRVERVRGQLPSLRHRRL